MLEIFPNFLTPSGFIPHGHCYLWKPGLVWLHIVSDSLIAISYYSIPLTLLYFVRKREDLPFNWIFQLFGAFIIACGTTHLMEIWTLWHPIYWVSGALKAITAMISVYTAAMLVPLVPKALALPSPAQLEAANLKLQELLSDRIKAESALQQSEAQLKKQAQELKGTLQELQRTQTQLIQSEKMSSLGELVAGIAHEINNPVNFIFGNLTHANEYVSDLLFLLKLYQEKYRDSDEKIKEVISAIELDFLLDDLPKLLASMKIGADRIQKIVASLRTFSRMDEAEVKDVNIHEGIESTLLILQHRLKAKYDQVGIQIIKEYGKLPTLECYAGQLNQVFMNLLSNAIDALESKIKEDYYFKPTIRIKTELVKGQLSEDGIETPEQVVIRIADNGIGMNENVKQRLFNPFFTTKSVGKGTGMGLAISYQIVVERHGGSLQCFSSPGEGTELAIAIPVKPVCCQLSAVR
ncbi:MAG TPA: sensor histidine kinase [Cyanobacteria bacterium UBA11369]|nr:sensor histidine kinase [Cyanobacteria bacterium UBA11371]HBE31099.1 sensor histidine kinase [Cyanobacteria bacterium UBA11368]HBE50487.1 sensor histidine kinase [Cyanobacteria bacterium UBA11369]